MSIRRDLLKAVEDGLKLPRTDLKALDKAIKDIEILARFANASTDKDAMDAATSAVAELRNRLGLATTLKPCAYCGSSAMRTTQGRVEIPVEKSKITLVANFIVCTGCGDMRTLVDPTKLPDSLPSPSRRCGASRSRGA